MKVGEEAFFAIEDMKIDVDHRGWIDPHAVKDDRRVIRSASGNGFIMSRPAMLMVLKRTVGGFQVDLSIIRAGLSDEGLWETTDIPNPDHDGGLPWYPVEKFSYGPNPL